MSFARKKSDSEKTLLQDAIDDLLDGIPMSNLPPFMHEVGVGSSRLEGSKHNFIPVKNTKTRRVKTPTITHCSSECSVIVSKLGAVCPHCSTFLKNRTTLNVHLKRCKVYRQIILDEQSSIQELDTYHELSEGIMCES